MPSTRPNTSIRAHRLDISEPPVHCSHGRPLPAHPKPLPILRPCPLHLIHAHAHPASPASQLLPDPLCPPFPAAFASAAVLSAAIESAGSLQTEAVRQALVATDLVEFFTHRVAFDANGQSTADSKCTP